MSTNDSSAASALVYANRRAQLRTLIEHRNGGNIAGFADQFGYSRSRVSQFLSETYNEGRSIGERAARALEEAAVVPFGWLDTRSTLADTTDHTAELRRAIAQTRHVFEGEKMVEDALHYLEQVLTAGTLVPAQTGTSTTEQAADTPTAIIAKLAVDIDTSAITAALALTEQLKQSLGNLATLDDLIVSVAPAPGAADQAAAACAAESAQLVADTEKTAAGAARAVDPLAVLSREVFSLSDKLQQPADLVVQLLVLAELRGLRAEYAGRALYATFTGAPCAPKIRNQQSGSSCCEVHPGESMAELGRRIGIPEVVRVIKQSSRELPR